MVGASLYLENSMFIHPQVIAPTLLIVRVGLGHGFETVQDSTDRRQSPLTMSTSANSNAMRFAERQMMITLSRGHQAVDSSEDMEVRVVSDIRSRLELYGLDDDAIARNAALPLKK
ncbi:hypothetical protein EWM64_g8045, partial [Hericium alpestre]